MHFTYDKFFEKIKEAGMTQPQLLKLGIVSGQTLNNMRHNGNVNTKTILAICEYFKCTPCDIMEFHAE